MRCTLTILILLLASPTLAEPDDYDPLLDAPSRNSLEQDDRLERPDARSPGFMVGGFLGSYLGATRSYLTKQESTLKGGARPMVGFGIGVRTRSPFEIGMDLGLGLGRTYLPKYDIEVATYDLLLAPRVVVHLYETKNGGLYSGLAAEVALFDVESAGLNQAGVGPGVVLGGLYRTGDHSYLFAELTVTALYDFLAFHYEDPSEEDLFEDPTLGPERIEGEWFGFARIAVGYRLTAL